MPRVKTMPLAELDQLVDNHVKNQTLEFISQTVAISLDELQNFINQVKSNADAIQIFFVRYAMRETGNANNAIMAAGGNLSQVSLVLTPAKIKSGHPEWIVQTIIEEDGSVQTLPVCDPSFLNDTGLCPPRGNCKAKGTSSFR